MPKFSELTNDQQWDLKIYLNNLDCTQGEVMTILWAMKNTDYGTEMIDQVLKKVKQDRIDSGLSIEVLEMQKNGQIEDMVQANIEWKRKVKND